MSIETQFVPEIASLISNSERVYAEGASVQVVRDIPSIDQIPTRRNHWKKVRGVISVFVDMKDSTQLSATKHDKSTAEIYQFFTDTVVRIGHSLGSSYIDVKGDGVFMLFNESLPYTALAAAVSCKSFANGSFRSKVKSKRDKELGSHIGIDQKDVLVKKVGIEPHGGGDSHLRNEVWAGRPVNMSAKLAGFAGNNELIASDRFYSRLTDRHATHSCGCNSLSSDSEWLWSEVMLDSETQFDFDKAYRLISDWCRTHGREYCQALLDLERDQREQAQSTRGVSR